MKKRLYVLICITALFFVSMAALTFTSRDIHKLRLPHVTAKRLTRESFTVHRAGFGVTRNRRLAISKALYDAGDIYIIVSRTVNGENRDFAQKTNIEIGNENEEFYEVTDGMFGNELVILHCDRPLNSGDEVLIVK